MNRRSALALVACLVAGCLSDQHTLTLELTRTDGRKETLSLGGPTHWDTDSLGNFFASWPDIAGWGTESTQGLLVDFYPLRPGTYQTGGKLFLGDEVGNDFRRSYDASITVTTERITWTGSRNFPFVQAGRLEGTTAAGHAFKGTFTISSRNCDDNVATPWVLCGRPFADAARTDQVWKIEEYLRSDACPEGIIERYGKYDAFTLTTSKVTGPGSVALGCTPTYDNRNEAVCGASEEGATYDGCKWSVVAIATPGSSQTENHPIYSVYAGTVDAACEPKFCAIEASRWTYVSGGR